MAAISSKGNDFGAFLGTLNQVSKTADDVRQGSDAAILTQGQSSYDTLLSYLATRDRPTSIGELADQTSVPFSVLAAALDTLRTAKLVLLTQDGNKEQVQLTDIGRQVAKLGIK